MRDNRKRYDSDYYCRLFFVALAVVAGVAFVAVEIAK